MSRRERRPVERFVSEHTPLIRGQQLGGGRDAPQNPDPAFAAMLEKAKHPP